MTPDTGTLSLAALGNVPPGPGAATGVLWARIYVKALTTGGPCARLDPGARDTPALCV